MNNNGKNIPYVTTGKIAKLLHISRVTVYNWIKQDKLKAVRVSQGKYRVLKKDFDEFLKHHDLENHVSPQNGPAPTIKVLVVDDESDVVEAVKTFLEKSNHRYHVLGVTNSFEAGLFMHAFVPDIVILDLFMPGIDGFSVCRRIKTNPQTRHIKIVAITGHATSENVTRIKEEGASEVLAKPFEYRKLLSVVENLAGIRKSVKRRG